MVETYGSWKVISQSSIPVRIDLDVKVSYNRNSSLSDWIHRYGYRSQKAEKA